MSKTTKKQPYLDAWLAANPKVKNAVGGTSAVLPEGASREEQDLASIYTSAAANAEAIDKRAQQSIFDANKANDLASKYLAAQNQANGLGGQGIADTSSLRLSSIYQKALADANATREQSLFENYLTASEKADTVRGEWASREEAKAEQAKADAQEKYTNAQNAILMSSDKEKVKQYLISAGYAEDSEDYNSLLNQWALVFDEETAGEKNTLPTADKLLDSGEMTAVDIQNYNIDSGAMAIDPNTMNAQGAINSLGQAVSAGKNQTAFVANILNKSKSWDSSKNGTYVDFNYGATSKDSESGTIYVFYNGKWYPTKYSRSSAFKNLGDNFYSEGNGRWIRGKDFTDNFGG